MRALVKRLADSGLTVLLCSHHMDEVEEICDNVTIMRPGTVVFHGAISDLRETGPRTGPPAQHRRRHAGRGPSPATATPRPAVAADPEGGLVPPARERLRRYVPTWSGRVALRPSAPTQTPLEALFFMLTESQPPAARPWRPAACDGLDP